MLLPKIISEVFKSTTLNSVLSFQFSVFVKNLPIWKQVMQKNCSITDKEDEDFYENIHYTMGLHISPVFMGTNYPYINDETS